MAFELHPIIQPHRRRGRPRRAIPIVPTSVRIPEDVYDAVARRALHAGDSVHKTLQAAIADFVTRRHA